MRTMALVTLAASLALAACDRPRPTVESIRASCDREFGAATAGSEQCQISLLARENARMVRDIEADQKARLDRAEAGAR